MAGRAWRSGAMRGWLLASVAALALAGCDEGFSLLDRSEAEESSGAAASGSAGTTVRLVERDIEAPQVFSVAEAGLWDGRPSLGGVWIAYPDVRDPERVLIRNPAGDKFVIGALFRRERDNPGPRLQVSSDAAAALGMLAGQPANLTVTALRREEVPEEISGPARPILDTAETVATESLDGPADTLASAAPAAAPSAAALSVPAPSAPTAVAQAAPAASAPAAPRPAATAAATGGRNLLQIGIFSVEANANRAATQARNAGTTATIQREESQGKAFWRVLVGPAANASERDALLATVRGLGYRDAYFVSR